MILLSSSSYWSSGIALSRTTSRILCFWPTTRTTQITASALSVLLDLAPPHKCSCPGMVLERASPLFIEWVLVSCKSHLTVDIVEDDTSPTPKPTADGEPKPPVTHEPAQKSATEPRIAPELEPDTSDQVHELAMKAAVKEITVGREGTEGSPAHCTAAGAHSAGSCQALCSPSAHHLWCGLAAGLPISSSTGVKSGGSLESISSLRGPDATSVLRPSGSTMASSSLVSTRAHQSTRLPRPSSFALISRPPNSTSGLHSSGCASSFHPSGSVGLLLPSSSTTAFRISAYASVAEATCSALALWILGSALARRLSISTSGSTIMAAAWVPPGSSCSKSLLPSPWLLPPPDLPWTLLSPPWLLPPSSPPWTLFIVLLPIPHPLLCPPSKSLSVPLFFFSTAQACAFREGGEL
ncbi:Protein kinase C-like [Labeo rohita]|uniref:Protein kinase C-like n=1 Tax=Labeo rohita TaxID=84645 RepID=A0ABQ8M9I7_LABRO|nr:Protein kinase C-like [Labeo rohita]